VSIEFNNVTAISIKPPIIDATKAAPPIIDVNFCNLELPVVGSIRTDVLALVKVVKRPGKAGANTGNAAAASLAAIFAKSIAFIAPCNKLKNVATPVNDIVIIFKVLPILFN
jgi:hypothetical protein